MPYTVADDSIHVIDLNSLEEGRLALHVREEHELDAEYFRTHEKKVLSTEKCGEPTIAGACQASRPEEHCYAYLDSDKSIRALVPRRMGADRVDQILFVL